MCLHVSRENRPHTNRGLHEKHRVSVIHARDVLSELLHNTHSLVSSHSGEAKTHRVLSADLVLTPLALFRTASTSNDDTGEATMRNCTSLLVIAFRGVF